MTLARSTLLGSACLVILAVALYLAKTEAERVRDSVERMERELVQETKAVTILEAELVWRSGPQRMETAARALGLGSITPDQLVALSDLDQVLSPEGGPPGEPTRAAPPAAGGAQARPAPASSEPAAAPSRGEANP
jgi:hypothetical protein